MTMPHEASMEVTESMVVPATQKSVDSGLISRRSIEADATMNRDIMHAILQAAFAAAYSKEQ